MQKTYSVKYSVKCSNFFMKTSSYADKTTPQTLDYRLSSISLTRQTDVLSSEGHLQLERRLFPTMYQQLLRLSIPGYPKKTVASVLPGDPGTDVQVPHKFSVTSTTRTDSVNRRDTRERVGSVEGKNHREVYRDRNT